ncbi:hypothetical protein GWD52_20555 [Enterobacteriaceae bacterium 4M9]|nr:hypothetical protein [Enterobacteriaceae bacterium 4M9]
MNDYLLKQIFNKITYTYIEEAGYYYLTFELNPEEVEYGVYSRYNLGFAIDDSPSYLWPSPKRNLNNNGKKLLPNYAYPSLPETVGEFVQRMKTTGNPQTNSIQFQVPGANEPVLSLEILIYNPDYPNWMQEDFMSMTLSLDENGWQA